MALSSLPPSAKNTPGPAIAPLRGRVNGSLAGTRGRVNGTRAVGDRGKTNGAQVRAGAPLRRGPRRRSKAFATGAVLALLLPALFVLGAPHATARFAADGDFSEWGTVTAVNDIDSAATVAPDLAEVRVASDGRAVFAYAAAREPFFASPEEHIVRVFVDTDADARTGFDLGGFGAEMMLEGAGMGGSLRAEALFAFESGRSSDDWHGWVQSGPGALAVRGAQLEAVIPGPSAAGARVIVAVSTPHGDDIQDPPASAAGALVVAQRTHAPQVIASGASAVALLDLVFSADGADHAVEGVTFAPSGAANFSALSAARVVLAGGRAVEPAVETDGALVFRFDPPLAIAAGSFQTASLVVTFPSDRAFDRVGGASFGARVEAADIGGAAAVAVLRPQTLPPSSYLGYVAATPVIDGAFGEWKLAGAAADPVDASELAGGDLVGVRAMTAGSSGAFFAETRGPILEGAHLADLPASVQPNAGPAAAAGAPPATPIHAPPLSADDRILVYLDTDRDPATGFQPAAGGPVGAEYVVQVSGRFSSVTNAHLLKFAGASRYDSAWTPVGAVRAAAFGSDIEGEIPSAVFADTQAARVLIQTVTWGGRTTDLSDVLQDATIGPVNPDHLLHFQAVTFDPLEGAPAVREALTTQTPNGYWVVQLNQAPEAAALGALEAAGATLYGYVHSNAYLAKMDEAVAASLRQMPEVRWVGIYQPAFKFATDPASWGEAALTVTALLFERPGDLKGRVEGAGGEILSASDAALRIRVQGGGAEALGFIPEIQFVEREHTRVPLNDVGRRLLGVNQTFDRYGWNGSGIVVGISDTGVDFTHPAFDDTGTSSPNFDGRIVGYFTYGAAYGDFEGHGTHTAGTVLGDGDLSNTVNNSIAGGAYQFRGMAPAAKLVETNIFDGSFPGDDAVFADQQAYGATVSSNSWGYQASLNTPLTDYDISAYLTDLSVIDSNTSRAGLQPMTIVFAAGNDGDVFGDNSVSSPGTAKNVITVGAVETDRGYDNVSNNASEIAWFSSLGPTDDGRIRPDVVAIGTYVLSTESRTSGCVCDYGGWDASWTGGNYAFSGGTSMATPMVAGIAALFQQYVNVTFGHIPSPALVKAALINGAEDMGYGYEFTGGVTGPMTQGWGRVNLTRSIDGPPNGRILLYEEGPDMAAGDVAVRRFTVANASTPLKVTTVWTDAPGNPSDSTSLAELVNDLDLVVRAPNGTFYHGNQFAGSWSRGNNSSFDRKNNVENVFVQSPAAGTWTVEVSGVSLKSAEQRFALAVSGNLTEVAPPSAGDAYAVPGAPANGRFGWNATAAGSINGDAYVDLVVGAPGANGGNGSVYIFFGGAAENFASFNVSQADVTLAGAAAEGFGSAVDTSGDFDNDGKRDLLIGAPSGGKAYLFKGAASWASRTPDLTLNGSSSSLFGAAVRLAAVDNVAGAEALVGAPLTSNSTGALYIFTGGSATGTWNASSANGTLTGSANGSKLGTSVSTGDADGDSKLDIAVGAPGASVVRLAHGGAAAGSLAFNATITGIPGTAFGQSVSLEGDHNGDGKADLLAGAPLANLTAGAGYVFFGRSPLANDQVLKSYFFDDMESGADQWVEMDGSSNASTVWSLTTAVHFGSAASGTSWQDSSGNYGNNKDLSIAFNHSISLSSATNPVLTFVYLADLQLTASNKDGFVVLYTLNSGSSWTQVDSSNTQGQYDTTVSAGSSALNGQKAFTYDRPTWRQVTFNVSSLVGNSSVKFRIEFSSDSGTTADGIYIDNFAVREARPSSPNFTVYGESVGDELGWSVASLGDANADGKSEFAFGAPYAPAGLASGAGAAYIFKGNSTLSGSAPALDAAEVVRGSAASDNLGWSLAPVTGFNGSSMTYLFAGAPGSGSGAGGGSIGDASAPIPEFSDLAVPAIAVAMLVLVGRRRRRGLD